MVREGISVALCTYNSSRFLQPQLESIVAQSRPPDELVVCDDGSTDRTREVVEAFARRAPFVTRLYVNQQTLGFTKNFERAIGLCTGDLIALADHDDVWHLDKLRLLAAALRAQPQVGGVFSDAELVDEQLRPLGHRLWEVTHFGPKERERFGSGAAFRLLLKRQVVTGATLCFRASFRNLILPIPSAAIHDAWIALLISAVSELAVVEMPLIKYRQHAANQIGARRLGFLERLARARRVSECESLGLIFERYARAHKRLRSTPYPVHGPEILSCLEEAMRHVYTRSKLPAQRHSRFPLVVGELASLRYFRYSNGVTSILQDLVL